MTTRPDWSLRIRLAGTLAAVVLLNVALLAVVVWGTDTAVTIAGSSPSVSTPLPILSGGLVVGAVGLVAIQARYGYTHALSAVDAQPIDGSDDDPYGLTERVRRLAIAADVPEPTVALADTAEANSFTVDSGHNQTIVVTTGLFEALSTDELQAVLVHEVAHLTNHDATVATIVATMSAISEALFARERRLGEWIRALIALGVMGNLVMILLIVPLLVLLIGFVLLSAIARLALAANAVCAGLHAQAREYAADRAAAELVGDPTTLASALETLSGGPQLADARLRVSATLGIVPYSVVVRGSESQADSDSTDSLASKWFPDGSLETRWHRSDFIMYRAIGRVGRALEWRPATHPPTETRVRRLLELCGEA